MKLITRFFNSTIFFCSLLLPQSASAYLQLTYNSNPLHFQQGYLGGDPDDAIGSDDLPSPSFSVIFDDVLNTTSSQSLNGTGTATTFESPLPSSEIPVTGGSITLNETGTPVAWNFSMLLTKSFPGLRDVEFDENGEVIHFGGFELPSNTSWLFESSYGPGTCNCERYRYDDDLYTERPYYSWTYANTIGLLYGADSSSDNWSITKTSVPEPKGYLIFCLGLIILGVRKMRLKKFI